ncbi:magnesium transporter CorA family protein [Dasania sp. GY-MA-18]|uniref:Magnesium transporter CorA family protein n=1 Tax=Dasania phycosphaerae TaxID=2950436 RepID=A0A9J6RLJ8_9GAMM|nr:MULTISPECIES: magnesium transporter CorA family protein [Dasania]MCR8922948.1 magnesium transporter CorA family protein [Dasania sp. GY-MA-18]MCZ0865379.1 magnesium transporter CorA family protein [Dasania phycosphaerae]MCZ0869104.1 magnesium transporter CorA family protein [Dasania phycosphaerae]
MINTYLYHSDNKVSTGHQEQIAMWQQDAHKKIWIDIQYDDHNIEQYSELLASLDCHHLAITDTFRKRHPPKVELFDDHIFLLYKGIHAIENNLKYVHQQIAFFISERLLITVHPQVSLGINAVLAAEKSKATFSPPIIIALDIIHKSAGIYLERTLDFENEISAIEDELRSESSESALLQLASYKAELIKLKRIFNYHNAIFAQLKTYDDEELPIDSISHAHKINDVAERLERLHSLSQMHYDICGDMIDSYISITSHQLNITMRILTVVTAIFVPLTFLAGIYGMNFEYIPELKYKFAYPALMITMFFMAITLTIIFKKKKWF